VLGISGRQPLGPLEVGGSRDREAQGLDHDAEVAHVRPSVSAHAGHIHPLQRKRPSAGTLVPGSKARQKGELVIVIGEKINGSIASVRQAIDKKDPTLIAQLAKAQADAKADYLDICAGTEEDIEVETLKWMVRIVQDAVDARICIDSPNPRAIEQVIPFVKMPGLINSVSMEGNKPDIVYGLAQEYGFSVIGLAVDDDGIPRTSERRIEIIRNLVKKAGEYGIASERLFMDPLVVAVSTDSNSMLNFVDTMRRIKTEFPRVKITSGLSNISFGMPRRKLVNKNFLCLMLYEGMDSAILDPTDKEMRRTLMAFDVLTGKDRNCRRFNDAFRKGTI